MDNVAALPGAQRGELFEATASARGIHPAIIEKDFWVCWVLKKLFASSVLRENLVFKGGTSLSKVFHLIERFSEDIDLVLNWELLGYGPEGRDPWERQASNTQLDRFNREFDSRAAEYISSELQPHVASLLADVPGLRSAVAEGEPQVIEIGYPAAFNLPALRPEIKLEIGPLAAWVPSAWYSIRPYAAAAFPAVFDDPDCPVVAIEAERTFWEKATILHQQAHRTTPMPPGLSRHYYDVHRLGADSVKDRALSDLPLLADVVQFKQRFYRCPWARYDDAKPGTFRLMPTDNGRKELSADYRRMTAMIFAAAPAWEEIMASLVDLEDQINRLAEREQA